MLHNSEVFFIIRARFIFMFGLNKLFDKLNPEKTAILTALSQYKSAVFPFGIANDWVDKVDKTNDGFEVHLNLPFSAKSALLDIEAELLEKTQTKISLSAEIALTAKDKFKQIKHIVLVASGKGGVGKSTSAVNLAYAMAAQGAKVGILDADIYGPSIPSLFALEHEKPTTKDNKTLQPIIKDGIKIQSIGFLVPAEDATVWRGPMASQALNQLLNETDWGELDYLFVDMPPGTGDIQLTMTQKVPASGAVIITTPQDLALADAQKGIAMFNQVNLPILGLIENMSHYICGHCGGKNHVFGQHGGERLASRHGVPLLAEIPLDIEIRTHSEQGLNIAKQPIKATEHYTACSQLIASMLHYQSSTDSQVEIVMTDD